MHHIKPIILKQDGSKRKGKGFSPNELKKAEVNRLQARQMGFPVDYKRKTAHDENVESIKAHAAKLLPALKVAAEKKSKKKAKS